MRWQFIDKTYSLAKRAYPEVKSLFVEWPGFIESQGLLNVYDLSKPEKPLAQIDYKWATRRNRPVIVLSSNNQFEFLELPSSKQVKFKVSHRTEKLPYPPPSPLSVKISNSDPVESLAKLASVELLKSSEGIIHRKQVEEWLENRGQDASLEQQVSNELMSMGINVISSFNMFKSASNRNLYQPGDRVRIMDPESTHYNKLGTVIGKGKSKENHKIFVYEVTVDGASMPIWFPPKALQMNRAGKPGVPV